MPSNKSNKPVYYKTKLKRIRKYDLDQFQTQRHANSTEMIGKNIGRMSPQVTRSVDSSSRVESPGTKATRMKKKILSMNHRNKPNVLFGAK